MDTISARSSGEVLAQLVRSKGIRVSGVEDVAWASVRVTPSDAGDVVDARRSLSDVAGVKALGYAVAAAQLAAHTGPVLVA